MRRNKVNQQFHVVAFNNQGRVTGQASNITCSLSKDGGARVPLDDVHPVEIEQTGEYVFQLTREETNGHTLSFVPVCSSLNVEILGMPSNVIYTSIEDIGVGMFSVGLTIKNANGALIPNCEVLLTSTNFSSSQNVVAGDITSFNGQVSFELDAGVYYIWRQKTGVTFNDNPRILTVNPDGIYYVT